MPSIYLYDANRVRGSIDLKDVNGLEYRIEPDRINGGFILTKTSFDDTSLCIIPKVSNQILIK